ALTGAPFVLAGFQVPVCTEPWPHVTAVLGEVTRKGPELFASSIVVCVGALLLTPPCPSRTVTRKWSDRGFWLTPASPTYDELGRYSEKQPVCASDAGSLAGGHVPLSTSVLSARIWSRSGNTRVGSVDAAFSSRHEQSRQS